MLWNEPLTVEQQVALNMGDDDWEEIDDGPVLKPGCSRAKTMEVERPAFIEPEPNISKHQSRRFDH